MTVQFSLPSLQNCQRQRAPRAQQATQHLTWFLRGSFPWLPVKGTMMFKTQQLLGPDDPGSQL